MNSSESIILPQSLTYHEIVKLLPYRSPWLLIDRLVNWDDKRIVVQKAISGADPMMAAHLSDGPSIMPGVLYIEIVGQAAMLQGVLSAHGSGNRPSGTAVLACCKGNFFSPAYIGETLIVEVDIIDIVAGKTVYEGIVKVEERLVCKVSGIGAFVDEATKSSPKNHSAN